MDSDCITTHYVKQTHLKAASQRLEISNKDSGVIDSV